MAATPKSIKSIRSFNEDSLIDIKSGHFDSSSGSWVEISDVPSHGVSSDNLSLEKIMQNELIQMQHELIQLSSSGSLASNRASPVNLNANEINASSKNSEVFFDEAEMERLRNELNSENFQKLSTDWIWYWKNESMDKRNLALAEKKLNLRQWAIRRGIFSKEVLSLLLLTNVVSVALGVGIGYSALVRRVL